MEISAEKQLHNIERLFATIPFMDGRGDREVSGFHEDPPGQRGFCARGRPIYTCTGTTEDVAVRRVLDENPKHYYGLLYRLTGIRRRRARDPFEILRVHYGLLPEQVLHIRESDRDREQPWHMWCRRVMSVLADRIQELGTEVHGAYERPAIDLTVDEHKREPRTAQQVVRLRELCQAMEDHHSGQTSMYLNLGQLPIVRLACTIAEEHDWYEYHGWRERASVQMAVRRDFFGLSNREWEQLEQVSDGWTNGRAAISSLDSIIAGQHNVEPTRSLALPELGRGRGTSTVHLPAVALSPSLGIDDAQQDTDRDLSLARAEA